MKQLMGDATTMSGTGLNANADLHEAGRLSGGVNLNRMDKGMDSRQMQNLMANYMNNIGDVGINANVSRPLERNLPADFYQENLMGSVPVGEGRLSAGIHGTHVGGEHHKNAHSLAYNTPFHGGHLSANIIKPIEGKPSYGVQYNRSFSGGGDITDPSEGKLHHMMSDLSDGQLQLILQHPTSMAELQSAQLEMSSRHQGMREGGAVAFAVGGSNDDPMGTGAMDITSVSNATAQPFWKQLFNAPVPPAWKQKLEQESDTARKAREDMSDYVPRSNANPAAVKEAFKKPEIKSGISDLVKKPPSLGEARKAAESMGVKTEDFDSIYKRVLGDLSSGNADIIKSIKELTAEQVGEAKNIKAEGDRKAMMNFGFNLAAEASRPGQPGNQGFAGLLRSAAAASPSYAASLADTEKMARESQRLANQMQIEMTKYQVALDKGDKSAAVQASHNIMNNKIQQQQVNNAYEHGKAMEKLEGQKIGMMGQRYAAMQGNHQVKLGDFRLKSEIQAQRAYENELKNNPMLPSQLKAQGITPEQYKKQRADDIHGNILQSMASNPFPLEE
jgi:hypothetical protein